jgi:hypothetical protein
MLPVDRPGRSDRGRSRVAVSDCAPRGAVVASVGHSDAGFFARCGGVGTDLAERRETARRCGNPVLSVEARFEFPFGEPAARS